MDPTDPYATARATIRDNVKWLATSFAAVAGIVLAGAPFSNLGSLPLSSGRFAFAILGLAGAAIFFTWAWSVLIFTLRPDTVYASYLRSTFDPDKLPSERGKEKVEIEKVRREFDLHKEELLPEKHTKLEDLENYVEQLWKQAERSGQDADRKNWELYRVNLDNISYWSTYQRLLCRVADGMRTVRWLGAIGLISLTGFAWAANPPKENDKQPITIKMEGGPQCSGAQTGQVGQHALEPVLFKSGDFHVTEEGAAAISKARNLLREHGELGLVLLSHTDTVGSPRINRDLSRERARAVLRSLIGEGGMAPARIFIAELPETDLPIVTAQETPKRENRAVEFLVVNVPPR